MSEETVEAIVVRSQDYQDRHRLITLFSPEGMVNMIVKNISRKNSRLLTLSSVFTHANYHYSQGRSELLRFVDATVLNEHLALRSSYSFIQTAATLTQAILSTQMPGKPSEEVFALYKAYLKQVPAFAQPAPLLCSFYLKLLIYEGLLTYSSLEEQQLPLATAQNFSTLHALSLSEACVLQISTLFTSQIS